MLSHVAEQEWSTLRNRKYYNGYYQTEAQPCGIVKCELLTRVNGSSSYRPTKIKETNTQ